MLMDVLSAMVNNSFEKSFYRKRKKKKLIFLQFFLFSIKVVSKLS